MATAEYYCRTWSFCEVIGPRGAWKAYPLGSAVTIGKQGEADFMLAWTDDEDGLHVLTGLTLEDGILASPWAVDLSTGIAWVVKLEAREEEHRIACNVNSTAIESNLTGNWGAEAPPREGEGQPSRLCSV